ncbi:MAG: exonuclease SbcCD subunit D [Chloroflexota bacterium]|nr:exonuclease SbcCD subunit D [Chloroflexota bacterium]
MQLKFLHAADIHLGYQQYGLEQRYDDFTEAFQWVVDTALDERVDFLLLAGDLFEKRTLDPRTLLIAVEQFERLKTAQIPVVAIEGNHERTYGDNLSWMEYLNQSGLLHLLDCARHDQGWQPQPWNREERAGGFVDIAGARIYGLKYQGAQTGAALSEIGAAIAAAPQPAAEFSIFLAHTSVEGYYDQGHPFARQQDLASLRQCVDYLALGHLHAPYVGTLGGRDWLFNPGCPETWSSEEWQYQNKGALFVEVDTNQAPSFKATPRNYAGRRPFIRIRQELDACPTPGVLLRLLEEKIRREPLPNAGVESADLEDASRPATGRRSQSPKSPVVEIVLTGVARFSRTEIDAAAIEQLAKKYIDPLLVRVRSTLQEAPASVVEDGSALPREVLERTVFENLIRADDRFASSAAEVAQVTVLLKQMVLDGVTASDIAGEMHSRLRTLRHVGQDDLFGTGPGATEPQRYSE